MVFGKDSDSRSHLSARYTSLVSFFPVSVSLSSYSALLRRLSKKKMMAHSTTTSATIPRKGHRAAYRPLTRTLVFMVMGAAPSVLSMMQVYMPLLSLVASLTRRVESGVEPATSVMTICDELELVSTSSFIIQTMVGIGLPVASHVMLISAPSTTILLGFSIDTLSSYTRNSCLTGLTLLSIVLTS